MIEYLIVDRAFVRNVNFIGLSVLLLIREPSAPSAFV